MTPPSSPQWTIDVNPPGVMPPCQVCESDRLDQLSQRMWAYLPTTLEALQVCLHCGNVLRAAPFPSEMVVPPHVYRYGGFEVMGDCGICGHMKDDPIHIAV